MCLTTSSITGMLLDMTTPYIKLIQAGASEWWHELYGRASFTHLAYIRLDLIHS